MENSTPIKVVSQNTGFAVRTLQKMCKSGKITASQDSRRTWHITTPVESIAALPKGKGGRKPRSVPPV